MLKEVIPKDKNAFVIDQNMQKWMGFSIQVLFYKLHYLMSCDFDCVTQKQILLCTFTHSSFIMNKTNQDMSEQQLVEQQLIIIEEEQTNKQIPSNKPSFTHLSQYL